MHFLENLFLYLLILAPTSTSVFSGNKFMDDVEIVSLECNMEVIEELFFNQSIEISKVRIYIDFFKDIKITYFFLYFIRLVANKRRLRSSLGTVTSWGREERRKEMNKTRKMSTQISKQLTILPVARMK